MKLLAMPTASRPSNLVLQIQHQVTRDHCNGQVGVRLRILEEKLRPRSYNVLGGSKIHVAAYDLSWRLVNELCRNLRGASSSRNKSRPQLKPRVA